MKIKEGILISVGIVISNIAFCQDTSHTKLLDKYYPKSEATTVEPNIAPMSRNVPLNNGALQQKPAIQNSPVSASVTAQPIQAPNTNTSEPVVAAPATEPIYQDINPQQQKPVVSNTPVSSGVIPQPAQKPVINSAANRATTTSTPQHIYRDTRLGSSSPLYDTYKKNDYGAGSVTTNPNKSSGSAYVDTNNPIPAPATTSPDYDRDRLGSSSPLYNTYEKNNNGAGSVTTSPK